MCSALLHLSLNPMTVYYDYVSEYHGSNLHCENASEHFIFFQVHLEDVDYAYLNVSLLFVLCKKQQRLIILRKVTSPWRLHSDVTSGYWGSQECRQNHHDTLFPIIRGDRPNIYIYIKISQTCKKNLTFVVVHLCIFILYL